MEEKKPEEIPWAWVRRVRDLVDNPPEQKYAPLPVEIVPWLLLSDERNARDFSKVRSLGITHVLSVNVMAPESSNQLSNDLEAVGISHRHIPGEDEEGYDMLGQHWTECRNYLTAARDGGGRVLVHCAAGINRSGLIACAAHMVLERVSVLDVVEGCVAIRGMVLWNKSFQEQLCVLAAREGLLGDKPEGYSDEPIDVIVPPPPRFNVLFDSL